MGFASCWSPGCQIGPLEWIRRFVKHPCDLFLVATLLKSSKSSKQLRTCSSFRFRRKSPAWLGRHSAANVRETFATPPSSLSAAPQAPSARCSSARRRWHLSPLAWLVSLALLPTTCRRRWSVPAWLTWSERVERNPWRLAGKKRNRPSRHAYVPAVRRPLYRLCDPLPESNESCRPRSRSRNSRSRYARDLEPGLQGSDH